MYAIADTLLIIKCRNTVQAVFQETRFYGTKFNTTNQLLLCFFVKPKSGKATVLLSKNKTKLPYYYSLELGPCSSKGY